MHSARGDTPVRPPIWSRMREVPVIENVGPEIFRTTVLPGARPVVLKRLADHWPAVRMAAGDLTSFAGYLAAYCDNRDVSELSAPPEREGRFFYSDDMSGYNFEARKKPLRAVLESLVRHAEDPAPPAFYAGAVSVREHLPSFLDEHTLDIFPDAPYPLASLWVGNRTRMAAHWDQADNVICVIRGRRRYTLFPMSDVENLYFGPLDFTLGGRPISLVDFHDPDEERHPNFGDAVAHGEYAELGPGDGLYIPNLWLHYAESLDALGVMMNHWWQAGDAPVLNPYHSLLHALLGIRDLPAPERAGWRALFQHFVFREDGGSRHASAAAASAGATSPDKALRLMAHVKDALERAMLAVADRIEP